MGKYSWKNYRKEKPENLKGMYDINIEQNKKNQSSVIVRDCELSNLEFKQIDTQETFSVFDIIEYRLHK